MRVKLAYKKTTACELYRVILPSQQLTHHTYIHDDKHRVQFDIRKRPVDIIGDVNYDVVVFPRPTHRLIADMIKILQSKGVAVVCEIDDDLHSISPHHSGWSYFQPHENPEHNWKNALDSCNAADWVTVTTDALAERYGKHGRVSVIPNYIPDYFIELGEKQTFGNKVVWGGMVASHPKDLQVMGGAIAQLTREGLIELHHVGEGDMEKITKAHNYTFHGACKLDDWPYEISKFNIGIAPVEESTFNESKSWIKPLEYSSFGMPWVAGNSTPYRQFNNMGVGAIARKPRQWYTGVKRLLNKDVWNEEHKRGLEVARTQVISKHAHKWDEAWESAVRHRKDNQ
jgi:glycosyltransferase involved in cell wall biosynthesis